MAAYIPATPALPGHIVAITPNDTNIFNPPLRSLWVGTTGALAILATGDTNPVTIPAVPVGKFEAVSISKVLATGTTASGILGFY